VIRLAQAPNLVSAVMWVDVLCQAGIDASLQRYFLGGVMGELPPDQCGPEVWLRHAEQLPQARQLLDDFNNLPQRRWLCGCGETVEGGFEQCWQCGQWMP
jgi:hypothetical protein